MSRALDAVVTIRMLKLLATPIQKSPAFTMGIVDANGKKLKNPSTAQEKNAYSFLNRFVYKVQRALTRSPDMNAKRLLSFAAAMALLREYKEEDDDVEVSSLLELFIIPDSSVIKE